MPLQFPLAWRFQQNCFRKVQPRLSTPIRNYYEFILGKEKARLAAGLDLKAIWFGLGRNDSDSRAARHGVPMQANAAQIVARGMFAIGAQCIGQPSPICNRRELRLIGKVKVKNGFHRVPLAGLSLVNECGKPSMCGACFGWRGWRWRDRNEIMRAAGNANRIDQRNGIIAAIFMDGTAALVTVCAVVGIECDLHLRSPCLRAARLPL
jgi:hypothetical protein